MASVLFPGAVFLHFPWLPERPDCNEGWLIFVKPPNKHPFLNGLGFSHLNLWGKQAVAFLGLLQVCNEGMRKFQEPKNSCEFWGTSQAAAGCQVPKRTEETKSGITGSVCKSIYHPLLPGFQEASGWLLFETGSPVDSYIPGWPGTECVAKGDLELLVPLPPLPECWDYGHMAPYLLYRVGD